MGKKTEINNKAYEINNKNLSDIEYCEAALSTCNGFCKRTIAHRKKRRFYNSVDELTNPNEVAIIGSYCHSVMEKDPKLTEEIFKRIRG